MSSTIHTWEIRIGATLDLREELLSTTFHHDLKCKVAEIIEKHLPNAKVETISQAGLPVLVVEVRPLEPAE